MDKNQVFDKASKLFELKETYHVLAEEEEQKLIGEGGDGRSPDQDSKVESAVDNQISGDHIEQSISKVSPKSRMSINASSVKDSVKDEAEVQRFSNTDIVQQELVEMRDINGTGARVVKSFSSPPQARISSEKSATFKVGGDKEGVLYEDKNASSISNTYT